MSAGALLVLALLGPAALDSVPAPASHSPTQEDVIILIQDDGEELGFFDEYFPLSLTENLDPSADKLVLPFFLAHFFLPFGWLWAPYVFADVKPGSGYLLDAVLIMIFHALVSGCVLPIAIIPIIGWLLFIPIMIFNLINIWYLAPVALINAYDRSIKGTGGSKAGGGEDGERRKKRKKRKRRRKAEEREEASLGIARPIAMSF